MCVRRTWTFLLSPKVLSEADTPLSPNLKGDKMRLERERGREVRIKCEAISWRTGAAWCCSKSLMMPLY